VGLGGGSTAGSHILYGAIPDQALFPPDRLCRELAGPHTHSNTASLAQALGRTEPKLLQEDIPNLVARGLLNQPSGFYDVKPREGSTIPLLSLEGKRLGEELRRSATRS